MNCETQSIKPILLKGMEISTFSALMEEVKALPYGRNEDRSNWNKIFEEDKGTCSSKHAFLKEVAQQNGLDEVKLILGIYKMNGVNTPAVQEVLQDNNMMYLPEAHCYLKINDQRYDCTFPKSQEFSILQDLIEEIEIIPSQVIEFKVDYHKEFIKKWILTEKINIDFDSIWRIREKCIKALSLYEK